jgi:hypothetical protein
VDVPAAATATVYVPRDADEVALIVRFTGVPDVAVAGVNTAVSPEGRFPAPNVID